jgi:YD repeat-containing protein
MVAIDKIILESKPGGKSTGRRPGTSVSSSSGVYPLRAGMVQKTVDLVVPAVPISRAFEPLSGCRCGEKLFSQAFTYDPLNRLNANTLGGVANQSWNLDSQGNWSSVTTNGVTQTRTANAQNQITSISGTSGTPAYDANGNMTTDQSGNTYAYNAWNQLVSVKNASGQVIAQYTYNAMGYRVTESYPQGGNGVAAGTVNYIYYDSQWQAIETSEAKRGRS